MVPARCLVAMLGALVLTSLLVSGTPAGDESPAPALAIHSLDQLACLSWAELECLYRQAEAGTIPCGYVRGKAVYCADEPLAGLKTKTSRLFWHGKHFCAADCTLVNQWLGFKAVHARYYYAPGWLDGKPSIILDYLGESRVVWADGRDELREIAPGFYVGCMYQRRCPEPKLKVWFVLESECAGCPR